MISFNKASKLGMGIATAGLAAVLSVGLAGAAHADTAAPASEHSAPAQIPANDYWDSVVITDNGDGTQTAKFYKDGVLVGVCHGPLGGERPAGPTVGNPNTTPAGD